MGGTHRVGPPLPQSTAEIISAAADRPPLSEQRPAPSEILASRGPSAKPTPQPQVQVGASETGSTPRVASPERSGTGESIRIGYAIRFRLIGKANPSTCHQGLATTLGQGYMEGVLGFRPPRPARLQVCYSQVVAEGPPNRGFQSPIPQVRKSNEPNVRAAGSQGTVR